MIDYVVGFMFSADATKLALITKIQPLWQRGRLNGIGGKIAAGERPIEAMVREFREETGVQTTLQDWQLFCTMHVDGIFVFCYKAFSELVFDCKTTEEEVVNIYPIADLPMNTLPNIHWMLPMALKESRPTTVII